MATWRYVDLHGESARCKGVLSRERQEQQHGNFHSALRSARGEEAQRRASVACRSAVVIFAGCWYTSDTCSPEKEFLRVAIVHDWLNQIGGAEGVLEELVQMFPGAPVYTSMYWPEAMPDAYRRWDIRTTWMDRLPGIHRHHQPYLLLYPLAFGGLDLSDYDLVVSNKSGFCMGVQTSPETRHICYCLFAELRKGQKPYGIAVSIPGFLCQQKSIF